MVQTVIGPISPAELGKTMMHEHLAPRNVPGAVEGRAPYFPLQTLEVMERELRELRKAGVRTVVDVTPYGKGRDPTALRELAERSGMNIVAATGFYKEPACPAFAHQASVEELCNFMVREIEEGIDGSGIRPGIIKVGTSKGRITPTERKILLAAATAHLQTGLPITTHTTLGTMGRQQADLLLEQGVDPQRIVIGHCDLNREVAYHLEILKTGVTIAFDTVGKESFQYRRHEGAGYERYAWLMEEYHVSDADRLKTLLELLNQGYAEQVVLSSDILWSEGVVNSSTIGVWGYSYLWEQFIPGLEEAGVSRETVSTIVAENPSSVLSGERRRPVAASAAQ